MCVFPFSAIMTAAAALSPHTAPAQQITLSEAWEVGSPWGPEHTLWKRIGDAQIIGDRVFVVDVELSAGRVFDSDGNYLKELGGGEGRGPSEFLRPSTITRTRGGVAVYDHALDRRVHFDSLGTHLETLRLDAPGTLGLQRVWEGRHGWWIGWTGLIGRRTPERSVSDHLVLAWNSNNGVDTVARVPGNPFWITVPFQEALMMHTTEGMGPSGGMAVLGDSLLLLIDGYASTVRFYDLRAVGPKVREERKLPGTVVPVTHAHRAAATPLYIKRHPGSSWAEQVHIGDHFPAWSKVIGGTNEQIWLRRGGPEVLDPEAAERWVRWDVRSGALAEVHTPPGVRVLAFGEDRMVGVREDALDVQYLVMYRMR